MKKIIIILTGALSLAILFGPIAIKKLILCCEEEVILRTIPVGSKDLFKGNSVTLSYTISHVRLTSSQANLLKKGDKVYVSLFKFNDYWLNSIIRKEPPTRDSFIKGEITDLIYSPTIQMPWSASIKYGIESYFIPEKKRSIIEGIKKKNLFARVKIDCFGNAVIKALILDGKEIEF